MFPQDTEISYCVFLNRIENLETLNTALCHKVNFEQEYTFKCETVSILNDKMY